MKKVVLRNLSLCTAFLAALLMGTALHAQPRGGDEGELRIVGARYGTDERDVDVTDKLREQARRQRSITLENSTFGVDPDPGRAKTLRVQARDRSGRLQSFEFNERDTLDGTRFSGFDRSNRGRGGRERGRDSSSDNGEHQILQARYGTANRNVDVTARLKALARQDRSFQLENGTFGVDPDPGRVKTLRIFAKDRTGNSRVFEYAEHSAVDGAQFTGWGRGDWGTSGWNGGWGRREADRSYPGAVDLQKLRIVQAVYGSGPAVSDVTDQLRALVQNGQLAMTVGNRTLGIDPAPDRPKQLRVTYTVDGRTEQQLTVDEGNSLNLP